MRTRHVTRREERCAPREDSPKARRDRARGRRAKQLCTTTAMSVAGGDTRRLLSIRRLRKGKGARLVGGSSERMHHHHPPPTTTQTTKAKTSVAAHLALASFSLMDFCRVKSFSQLGIELSPSSSSSSPSPPPAAPSIPGLPPAWPMPEPAKRARTHTPAHRRGCA